jgi:hypothetical protein
MTLSNTNFVPNQLNNDQIVSNLNVKISLQINKSLNYNQLNIIKNKFTSLFYTEKPPKEFFWWFLIL